MSDRNDSDNMSTRVPQYEMAIQAYSILPWPNVHMRSGLRLGMEGAADESHPLSLEVKESGTRFALESGVVLDGPLLPSASIQALVLRRSLELDTHGTSIVLTPQSKRTEWLFGGAFQVGLGIPIQGGRVLLEPFYRVLVIPSDVRQSSQWGGEVSWAFDELKQ
jgi:hypothetical protein